MAQPGYSLLVRKGGFPVGITAEATTNTSGNIFQITSAARRVLDPATPWHVKDGAATLAYSAISSVDFLSGEITLGSSPSTSVFFTGNYIPITTATDVLFECRDFTLGDSADLLDTTIFTGTTERTRKRIQGLNDVELSAETLMDRAQMAYLSTVKFRGDNVVTEVYFGDAAQPRFRGFCKVESIESAGNVEGLLSTSIVFKIATVHDTVANQVASYTYTVQPNV